jgi:rifampicin phosphotransferase
MPCLVVASLDLASLVVVALLIARLGPGTLLAAAGTIVCLLRRLDSTGGTPMDTTAASDVIDLTDERAADPARAGRKAATLAALAVRGFPVPPGFVVTTSVCERLIGTVDDAAEDLDGAEFPGDVWVEIVSALRRLGSGPVAVRSSGTAEDLADASYAGQYETVLGVNGPDELAQAIRRCLASASSARVRAYSGSRGDPMAVLVQRLVPAEAAGVVFTANPVTGDQEILVSAVRGVGERLVSGEATPDEWVVRGDEVRNLRVTENAIDLADVREVVALARRVEEVGGRPQDLEWAIAGGDLFLLQARPITALPRPPQIQPPTEGFWTKDTTHYPMPLTPFGASVYLSTFDRASPVMGEELGLLFEGFEQRCLGGEVYVHFIPVGGKDRKPPPSWVMWIAARIVPALRRRNRVAAKAIAPGFSAQLLDRWETEWRDAFRDEAESLKRVDLRELSDVDLLGHLDLVEDFLDRGQLVHFRLNSAYVLPVYDLLVACEDLLGWDSVASLALVAGSSDVSAEPGRELLALASRFAADAAALRALEEAGGDVLARLQEASPELSDAFRAYLDRYGHRTAGYDPGDPTLFERPALLASLLRDRINAGDRERRDGGQMSEDALARAHVTLAQRSDDDRDRFERTLETARRVYGNREDNIFWLDNQPCAFLRYTAVEIGRRLTDRGLLAGASDAVFLEETELRRALVASAQEDLRALVTRRKAERAWVAAHPGPVSYGTDPGPPPDLSPLPPALRRVNTAALRWTELLFAPEKTPAGQAELAGVPGSPGRYTGAVRLIRDEADFPKLRPGDVLVCPITSPAWSVLFVQAGAVVTDGGGVLAHTAVIAREYGVPAVLATGAATQRLRDGDLVTVDGTAGVVTINEAQHPATVQRP